MWIIRSHKKKTVETVRMNDMEKKKIESYNNLETFFFKKEIDQKGKLNRGIQRIQKEGAGLKTSVKLPIT